MSNTLAFTFENTSLTILGDILNPLFIAKQICDVLGFANHKDAIKNHVDPDDIFKLEMNDRLNRKQTVNCVNESGLYALIFGSKLPKAKQFKRWVTNEVLPAIRKQGCYSAQEQDNALISNEQQYELSSRVMRKTHALFGNKNYSFVYRALKRRFRIPRYTCLLQRDFEAALAFVDGLKVSDFNVPDVKEREVPLQNYVVQFPSFTISSSGSEPLPAVPAIPVSKHYITDNELQAIKSLIYYFDDLFKPQIQWASKEAYRQGRPDASRFYDVWHEPMWFISRMRQLVSRNS
ncbi:MAG: BRO family protein [Parasutterella excrementihominis]|jgi:prophage antirepressor-like protein|uniref:BRO family protein n=1 Tax=Parasutterella excrementihominis TaxID=487175 RepID=UPI00204D8ED6|nr:MAG TPA: repressor domain protein [Caudoviricetes sp.]